MRIYKRWNRFIFELVWDKKFFNLTFYRFEEV